MYFIVIFIAKKYVNIYTSEHIKQLLQFLRDIEKSNDDKQQQEQQ